MHKPADSDNLDILIYIYIYIYEYTDIHFEFAVLRFALLFLVASEAAVHIALLSQCPHSTHSTFRRKESQRGGRDAECPGGGRQQRDLERSVLQPTPGPALKEALGGPSAKKPLGRGMAPRGLPSSAHRAHWAMFYEKENGYIYIYIYI